MTTFRSTISQHGLAFLIAFLFALTLLVAQAAPALAHKVPCTHGAKQVGAHGKTHWVRAINLKASGDLYDHFHVQDWKPVRGGIAAHRDTVRCGQWSRNDGSHVWHWHEGMSREQLYRHPLHPTSK